MITLTTYNEDTVRAAAHQMWEDEGRPNGRAEIHWQWALAKLQEPVVAAAATDVSLIDGVGPKITAQLAAEGITSLVQIVVSCVKPRSVLRGFLYALLLAKCPRIIGMETTPGLGECIAATAGMIVESHNIKIFNRGAHRVQVIMHPFSFTLVGDNLVGFFRLIMRVGDERILAKRTGHTHLLLHVMLWSKWLLSRPWTLTAYTQYGVCGACVNQRLTHVCMVNKS